MAGIAGVITSLPSPTAMVGDIAAGLRFAISAPGIQYGIESVGANRILGWIEAPLAAASARILPPVVVTFLVQAFNSAFNQGLRGQTTPVGNGDSGSSWVPGISGQPGPML